ncbi:MAG: hybrid sensor histidine kinase/response regulator, partial [Bacteroidales bacterium]|nr:hybrid sensor histidine kinase/response regulator [Bacteroidales bacterium]
MMISRSEKFIYFSLTLILLPYLLFGGSYRYITTENGLKNNAVYVITQDSKGLMWFGTIIGLYNYDGNTIKNIPPDSELGVGTLIYSITEDSQSRLWIGTNTGLSILDLKTEKYLPFDYCTPENTHIKSAVRNVMIDSRGTAWISTMGQGIFLFDLKKGTLSQITTPDIPDNMIKHTMEGRKGNIWITTINGFLIKYNPGIKEFTVFKDDKIHKGWIGYEDMEANIWMGTAGGLFLFNKKTGHFSQKVMPLKPDGILEIKSIVEPEPGELLLATDEGLIHYNIHSGKIIIEKGESLHQPGLNDNYLHALYLDRENGLWVGTYFGGINYLSPTSSNFGLLDNIDKRLNVKVVSVFAKDSTDNLWIGTDDAGILYVNRKTGKIISFNPEKSNIKVPTYQNIHALLVDGDNLYIGMYMGGLDIYNTKTGKLKNFHQSNSVNSFSSNIYALYKDMYGIIWIGTQGGLNTYDPRIGKFHYCNELGNIDVSNIKEDTGGNLWVSTLGNGIFRLNRKTGKWKNYYPVTSDNIRITRITYICFDESRNLWIGTEENGLCRFDYKKESFTNYPLKDAPSQVVYCIIPDKNYLWISTTNGIIQFDRSSGKIKCFNMG